MILYLAGLLSGMLLLRLVELCDQSKAALRRWQDK